MSDVLTSMFTGLQEQTIMPQLKSIFRIQILSSSERLIPTHFLNFIYVVCLLFIAYLHKYIVGISIYVRSWHNDII